VRYTSSNTYVNATGVPSHSVGPFTGNPNNVANQNSLYRVPRSPLEQSGTKTSTSLGAIGFMVNGVAFFNASDGMSYLNKGIWNQNANVVEAPSFDAGMGHPQQSGQYHYHQQPLGLRKQLGDDGTHHSPLLGFAFDGFPVYGPYGYANTDGTGGVTRITSSYQLRNITTRTTKPDGTVLTSTNYGPAVSTQYPLGYYLEDYTYSAGSGMLDAYNGRFTITPEYPQGTYSYFKTLDSLGAAAYPYIVGPQYYGQLQNDNRTKTVSVDASAATFTTALSAAWSNASDGTWCNGSNWTGGTQPGGAGSYAAFIATGASSISVNVDSPVRIGTIDLATSTAHTIAGASQITLMGAVGSTGNAGAGINVSAGNHVISTTLVIASAATFNVASGASLELSKLQGSAVALFKTGAGSLKVG